jgi:phosphonate transport system substrate-binding protein
MAARLSRATRPGPAILRVRSLACRAALGLLLLVPAGCSPSDTTDSGLPETLQVGVIPNVSPETQRAHYEPFRKYLADRLKVKVELFVATNYAGVVAALVAKKIDVAYLGGLTYVQAAEQSKVTPMLTEVDTETGTPKYLSATVVKSGSPFRSVRDVVAARGRFAFGDPSSTSGSLYPRVMITEAGARCETGDLSRCPPLRSVTFTGGHDATAHAVRGGSVEAGGLELRILHRLERQGTIPKGELRVIETRPVMGYPWVAREGLGEQARQTVVTAFLGISDPKLLDLMRARRYVRVSTADYAETRTYARRLGLLAERG